MRSRLPSSARNPTATSWVRAPACAGARPRTPPKAAACRSAGRGAWRAQRFAAPLQRALPGARAECAQQRHLAVARLSSPPSSTTCPPLPPRIASSKPSHSDRQTARSSSAGTSCVATAIYVSNPSVAWLCEPVAPTSVPRKRTPVAGGEGRTPPGRQLQVRRQRRAAPAAGAQRLRRLRRRRSARSRRLRRFLRHPT